MSVMLLQGVHDLASINSSKRGRLSIKMTGTPIMARIDAYSVPITPPPTMTIDDGRCLSLRKPSVSMMVSSSKGMSAGRPDGGGRNIVNVILVDFRAFDTMGEIVVLTVTALGVMGLVRAARRGPRARARRPRVGRLRTSTSTATGARASWTPPCRRCSARCCCSRSCCCSSATTSRAAGSSPASSPAAPSCSCSWPAARPRLQARSSSSRPRRCSVSGSPSPSPPAPSAGTPAASSSRRHRRPSISAFLGSIKLSTVLLFDVGVYLVVIGLVVALLESLGPEEQVQAT